MAYSASQRCGWYVGTPLNTGVDATWHHGCHRSAGGMVVIILVVVDQAIIDVAIIQGT